MTTFAKTCLVAALFIAATAIAPSYAQQQDVIALAQKEREPLLKTLEELVSIEFGSRDFEGLDRIAKLIAGRLQALGGQVELVEASDIYKMEDTPPQIGKMVRAHLHRHRYEEDPAAGTYGYRLSARDAGEAAVPHQGRARLWGVGIADDKQGIAVIIHTVAMLKALNFRDYGTLTVLINADEEISSPGSRSLITRLGAEHDASSRSRARARSPTSSRSRPPASPRSRSTCRAGRRMPAATRSAASTRSMSFRIRYCRCATSPTPRPASR